MIKKCIVCHTNFNKITYEETCSLKCKILKGIEKNSNDCWIYKNSSSGAYSKFRWKKKWFSAHRISYEVFKGLIPKNKWVCHHCDTPKCVNPEHLFIGSPSENRRDAMNKKRIVFGEKSHFSKFNDIQIEEIRLLKNEGFTYKRISRIFNCSFTHIYNIIKKKNR